MQECAAPPRRRTTGARVLVVGVPRSSTTWVGSVLAAAPDTILVHEPDNREVDAYAGVAKRGLGVHGFFPVVAPGERASEYGVLWRLAMRGGWPDRGAAARLHDLGVAALRRRRLVPLRIGARVCARLPAPARNVVVKSVHSILALEWVAAATGATVVVVHRDVEEVVASWIENGFAAYPLDGIPAVAARWLRPLGFDAPPRDGGVTARVTWTVAALDAILREQASRHPEWLSVRHRDLCADAERHFSAVARAAGLAWSAPAAARLAGSDAPGSGYAPQRVRSLEPGKWRRRLTAEQADEVTATLRSLPPRSSDVVSQESAARGRALA